MIAQTRSQIAQLLASHGLAPVHRLGQHFLADANITRKIVALSGVGSGSKVIEIGAGTGTLTSALAATGASVVAIEVDEGLRPVLEETTSGLAVELVFADATKLDLDSITTGDSWVLVANLPYNVGTPLVMDALRHTSQIGRFVVMVQKEVALRLAASPGTPHYGLPSVVTGIFAPARLEFNVPSQVFFPSPKVESAVVVMDRVPVPAEAERAIELARAGFEQRRKMLRGSLKSVLADTAHRLEDAGIDSTQRAENLAPEDWLRLARS